MFIDHKLIIKHERDIVLVIHIDRILQRSDLQSVHIGVVCSVQCIVKA